MIQKVLLILLLGVKIVFAQESQAHDLFFDSSIFDDELENGMRYVIMPNDGPQETASVRLYFDIGSLHEKDHERGFAHFVEHMAFNGSTNFPEGELVKTLQNAGLAFGAHANASTNFDRTIYSLELPNVESETIKLALKALRETSSNLTFTPEAIDRERGVLVSELDSRNGKGLQVFREQLKFWSPTSRTNVRFAAGTKETIESATREELVAFYNDFYRPENAYLVFVGDVEVEDIEVLIEEIFGDWTNDTVERDTGYMDIPLPVEETPQNIKFFDLDGITTSLSLTMPLPFDAREDSVAKREDLIIKSFANTMFAQRLNKLTRQDGAPILSLRVSYTRLFEEAMLASLTVNTSDENIYDAAGLMEQEIRRVLTHGFTEDEVVEQKANFKLSYQYQVDAAEKRQNNVLANAIVNSVHTDTVFIHPDNQLAIYEGLEPRLNVDVLNAAFADMWDNPSRYFALTNTKIDDAENRLQLALEQSRQVAVAAPEVQTVTEFAYTDFGTPGKVVYREEDEDFRFTKIRFENNLKVNLKPTTFEDNTVRMSLTLGGGVASMPKEFAGIQNLVNLGFVNGGLGAHEVTDIPRLMAGTTASIRLQASNSSYSLPAGVIPADMLKQFQLWAAYLTDAAYRPSAHSQYVRAIENYFQSVNSTPGGVFNAKISSYLYGDDPRFNLQSEERLKELSMQDLRSVLADVTANGALELTVVGDFEIDAAIEALSVTLGALPKRRLVPELDPEVAEITFPEGTKEVVFKHTGGADQALLRMYWPTVGPDEHGLNAKLYLLRHVLQVMMTETLREEEGLAYTPSVSKLSYGYFDDYGFLTIATDISPGEIEQAKAIFLEVVNELVSGDIEQDVIERARKPILEQLRNRKKNNSYWLRILDGAQSDPDYLQYDLRLEEAVTETTLQDLVGVARQFMSDGPRLTVSVIPEPMVAEDSAAPNVATQ
ncbi:M16 family metallopeptidase [Kordiimonas aquimaris]|uniref:M16 family metallopeptidase n=1 Tax=Kordiimonas aquimaris TaxID=707591 RepID=UPI0021D022EA|nr:insulinase family protein [Kordiimonas aquimaris]